MKIRNNTRIVALVLALVMLLPLISIPAFAEDTPATPEYSENFDGKTLADVSTVKPASAQILAATVDSANHGDVVQIDVKGMNTAPYYLWKGQNEKWAITGEVVDGKISGTANGLTVPATDVPANDDATVACVINGTNYKIVTGTYADSMGGFTNVAKTLTLKNPAFASADADFVAIAFDIYLSEDFKNSSDVSGRIVSAASGNVELFGITAPGGNNPTLSKHENGAIVNGSAQALKKGAWNSLLFIINMSTAAINVYVDGEYAFRVTNKTAINKAIDLKANNLQIQVDRTSLPSTNGGYFQIDNVVMTSDLSLVDFGATLYSQDFNSATQASEVLSNTANAALATVQAAAANATEHGKVFHAPAQPGGEGYAIWKKGNAGASPLTSYTIDPETGLLTGTASNGVKVKDATINEYKAADPTIFAKLEDGSTSAEWCVVDTRYVDARYGGWYNIAGNGGRINNPAVASGYEYGKVALSASYYFSDDASFGTQGRLYAKRGSDNANKAYDLFRLTARNGYVTVANHDDATKSGTGYIAHNLESVATKVATGRWFDILMIFDLATARMDLYVDGAWAFSITDSDFSGGISEFQAGTWSLTMFSRGASAVNNKGYCEVDNVSITYGNKMPEGQRKYIYRNVFDQKAGEAPFSYNLNGTTATVSDAYGSGAMKIDFQHYGKNNASNVNINKNPKLVLGAVSYSDYDTIVIETDYFIDMDARGRTQSQYYQATAFASGATSAATIGNGWLDAYVIDFQYAGYATLQLESGTKYGYAKMDRGTWNTVSVVLDLDAGTKDIYLNGAKVISTTIGNGTEYTNVTLLENNTTIGKLNDGDAYKGTGTMLIDNILIYEGDASDVVADNSGKVHDFEGFKYSEGKSINGSSLPALATYVSRNGNMAVHLPMRPAASSDIYTATKDGKNSYEYNVVYTPGEGNKVTLNGTEYTTTFDEKVGFYKATVDGTDYYLLPADLAETAISGANVGKAFKLGHDVYSYTTTPKVTFEADYFIEDGSNGVIESQFETFYYDVLEDDVLVTKSASFMQLYQIKMTNGQFDGTDVYLTVGAWNRVTLVMDLVAGEYDMYVNGVFAKHESAGHTNLKLGTDGASTWSIAKVQRQGGFVSENFVGAILVDNVSTYVGAATSNSKYGANFLTDADFEAFVADMLTAIEGASIRLTLPAGLRFASVVNSAKLNYLTNHAKATTAMGTLIAPEAYKTEAGDVFTKEALNALNHTVKYIDVKFDGDYFDGAVGVDVGDNKVIAGSIVNIKKDNVDLAFAGAAYVEITIGDATYTVYADAQVRSVQDVATALKTANDGVYESLTATPKDIVDKFAAGETIYTEIEA